MDVWVLRCELETKHQRWPWFPIGTFPHTHYTQHITGSGYSQPTHVLPPLPCGRCNIHTGQQPILKASELPGNANTTHHPLLHGLQETLQTKSRNSNALDGRHPFAVTKCYLLTQICADHNLNWETQLKRKILTWSEKKPQIKWVPPPETFLSPSSLSKGSSHLERLWQKWEK